MKNEFKKVYLEYLDKNGDVIRELKDGAFDMVQNPKFDLKKFYQALNQIITEVSGNDLFQLIRIYPMSKPIYLFGVLYYYLKDLKETNSLEIEFEYLEQFVNYKIDLFMIVNHLR